jgi:trimethylamine--corrinoid protein Co-methyltransferase
VDEDTLALDVIRQVGVGGNFLGEAHTYDHFRQELWFPTAFDRRRWDEWWADGARTMADWAHEHKVQILEEHHPTAPDPDLVREIDSIVAAARRDLLEQ